MPSNPTIPEGYTPTIDEVRDAVAGHGKGYANAPHYERQGAGFDRWLADHDRQVAEKAWGEGFARAQALWPSGESYEPVNPYAAIVSVTTPPEPCKCHQNFAYIVPTHSGHCCFMPADQTCHQQEVAAWEAKLDARKSQAPSTPEQEGQSNE